MPRNNGNAEWSNRIEVVLAIGGTDENVVFGRGFSLPALSLASTLPCLLIIRVKPLEESQQHGQQSARDLIHLIIIATRS